MLTPSRFSDLAVPQGTGTVVAASPHTHEIANVLGTAGLDFMRADAAGAPWRRLPGKALLSLREKYYSKP